MKKSTLIFVTLLFLGVISANEELDQKPNLEGYWFAVFLPLFHEEAVEIIKSEEELCQKIPIGEISVIQSWTGSAAYEQCYANM